MINLTLEQLTALLSQHATAQATDAHLGEHTINIMSNGAAKATGSATPTHKLTNDSAQATDAPWVVGQNYIIRTVTMMHVGKLFAVYPTELVMVQDSWIADAGRWHLCLRDGIEAINDIEPFNPEDAVIIGRGSVIDATIWRHALPKDTK